MDRQPSRVVTPAVDHAPSVRNGPGPDPGGGRPAGVELRVDVSVAQLAVPVLVSARKRPGYGTDSMAGHRTSDRGIPRGPRGSVAERVGASGGDTATRNRLAVHRPRATGTPDIGADALGRVAALAIGSGGLSASGTRKFTTDTRVWRTDRSRLWEG